MTDQIVITEKTSQAKDVRAAVGGRYGAVLPAEGHLFDLVEPEEVDPAWKRWTPVLLRPEGLYATKPAQGGNKASKLQAIRTALRSAKRVWLATDCDREGQLIGQEILEHLKFRGTVMRVIFTAQDPQTIRDAFAQAKPNAEYARLYAAAVARRQADQIYNLSLTRTATVTLARGARWRSAARRHLDYGLRGVTATLASEINSKLDVWMLGIAAPNALVGVYSLASSLYEGVTQLAVVVQNNVNPVIARELAADHVPEVAILARRTRRWFVPALVAVCAVSAAAYPIAIPWALGDRAFAAGAWPFAIMMLGIAIASPYLPFIQLLLMAARPGWHTVFIVGTVTVNLVGTLVLIAPLGMIGAAISTASSLVASAILLRVLARSRVGLRL